MANEIHQTTISVTAVYRATDVSELHAAVAGIKAELTDLLTVRGFAQITFNTDTEILPTPGTGPQPPDPAPGGVPRG